MPHSPLPPVLAKVPNTTPAPARWPAFLSWHIVAPATLLLLFVVAAILLSILGPSSPSVSPPGPADVRQDWQAGQVALAQGRFQTASRELNRAVALQTRCQSAFSLTERRRLRQLQQEANLLADLLIEPLDEIARRAARLQALDMNEWQAVFNRRYRGQAILLDGVIRPNGPDHYEWVKRLDINGDPGWINLDDLALLRHLPLDGARRLIFGARLAGIRLERNGGWRVDLEPDSGVLLTEAQAIKAVLPHPVPTGQLQAVLQEQRQWAEQLP